MNVGDKKTVSAEWLLANADAVKIVDASWAMRANRKEEYGKRRIAGALFFCIDECSDHSVALPHQMPSEEVFNAYCQRLGLCKNDAIVLYDVGDAFMSARVWFMLSAFGHTNVAILDGGLSAWAAAGGALHDDTAPLPQPAQGDFCGTLDTARLKSMADVKEIVATKSAFLIDARPAARFLGQVDEPRAGLLRGHLPGAANLPFEQLSFQSETGVRPLLKSADTLRTLWTERGASVDDVERPILCSCGSGVTACQLIWSLNVIGRTQNVWLYNGSWSEWGATEHDVPREL